MKRVALLRSNPVQPDPPVEKMADALLEMGMQVDILAWDRSQNNNCCNTEQFPSGTAQVTRFGIPAVYGARWGTMCSLLRFEWSLWVWLVRNRKCYDMIHAFDLDTLEGSSIVVRRAQDGETLVTLDEKERVLNHNNLVICDKAKAVGLAGVIEGSLPIGGLSSSAAVIIAFLTALQKEMKETFPNFEENPYYKARIGEEERMFIHMQQKSTRRMLGWYEFKWFVRRLRKGGWKSLVLKTGGTLLGIWICMFLAVA